MFGCKNQQTASCPSLNLYAPEASETTTTSLYYSFYISFGELSLCSKQRNTNKDWQAKKKLGLELMRQLLDWISGPWISIPELIYRTVKHQ